MSYKNKSQLIKILVEWAKEAGQYVYRKSEVGYESQDYLSLAEKLRKFLSIAKKIKPEVEDDAVFIWLKGGVKTLKIVAELKEEFTKEVMQAGHFTKLSRKRQFIWNAIEESIDRLIESIPNEMGKLVALL